MDADIALLLCAASAPQQQQLETLERACLPQALSLVAAADVRSCAAGALHCKSDSSCQNTTHQSNLASLGQPCKALQPRHVQTGSLLLDNARMPHAAPQLQHCWPHPPEHVAKRLPAHSFHLKEHIHDTNTQCDNTKQNETSNACAHTPELQAFLLDSRQQHTPQSTLAPSKQEEEANVASCTVAYDQPLPMPLHDSPHDPAC
jgi:hypothetical protein